MSLGTLSAIFSKISLMLANTIAPSSAGSSLGLAISEIAAAVWQWICSVIYSVVQWMLAFVDFMQYFVQKLIGLDYWLNQTKYTLDGAIESDIIFGFLYHDTIQDVFRAMVAIFFVLLIIFTIYSIVKSEWEHIAGKGGKFGDGVGNSKNKIFKSSLKAIVTVLIFPLVLVIGVISANAILASLIKALNINTASTLGGQIFQIASQTASKYQLYAQDNERGGVSDEVSFYITPDGRYLKLSKTEENSEFVYAVNTYEKYLEMAATSTKYTVNSVFEKVKAGSERHFYGYCVELQDDFFVMAACTSEDEGVNSRNAMRYYLQNVLQANIVTVDHDFGFKETKEIKSRVSGSYDKTTGYIQNLDLTQFYNKHDGYDVVSACVNTWNYSSIYANTFGFEDAENYMVIRSGSDLKVGTGFTDQNGNGVFDADTDTAGTESVLGGTYENDVERVSDRGLLYEIGLDSVSSAKIMYNDGIYGSYFDGGQLGVVQLQSEYLVMGEVVNFINQNDIKLNVLDITSDLIDWSGLGSYKVDTRWIAIDASTREPKYAEIADGRGATTTKTKETLPFIISYSDLCNDTEMGNVLYFGDRTDNNSELKGSKYIMCIPIEGGRKFIPLVNNMTYTDPETGYMYNFKSEYYSSNYHGVVLAKAVLETKSLTNATRGQPTYFISGSQVEADNEPYYFDMAVVGEFNQYGTNLGSYIPADLTDGVTNYNAGYQVIVEYDATEGTVTDSGLTISGVDGYSIRLKETPEPKGSADYTKNYDILNEYQIYQTTGGTTSVASPSLDVISNLKIKLKKACADVPESFASDGNEVSAEYAEISKDNNYLFYFDDEGARWYFIVQADKSTQTIKLLEYQVDDANKNEYGKITDETANSWGVSNWLYGLVPTTYKYTVKYDYTKVGETAVIGETLLELATAEDFVYSRSSDGYTVYRTVDMQNIKEIDRKLFYFYISFDTTEKSLINIVGADDNLQVQFAKMCDSENVQGSKFVRFYLYDYYTAYVDSNPNDTTPGQLKQFNLKATGSDSITDASLPSTDNDDYCFDLMLSVGEFETKQKELGGTEFTVSEGDKFVKINKLSETVFKEIGLIPYATSSIEIDGNKYYSVRTQNDYKYATNSDRPADESEIETMEQHYNNVRESAIIQCMRASRGYALIDADVAIGGFFFTDFRWKWQFFFTVMDTRSLVGYEFKLTNGIEFDYFFEANSEIDLATFYVPSEISYWIIVIASMLMIKVLGSAIWGVIKRIYEITLYFIAAPAVASTMPLDEGARFHGQIMTPLIKKVLNTYGTMLGLNVFFILLYPVKSLSQIFTAEDIATSNSYFLKHFMGDMFSYQTRANLLNLYVYILFVLVAFTMISALPSMLTQMTGGDTDLTKSGNEVKNSAMGALKGAADMVSGKPIADAAGKTVEFAKNSLPGRAASWAIDKFKKGRSSVSDDDDGDSSGSSSGSGGGDSKPKSREEEAELEVENAIDSKVSEATGGKFNTYQDAIDSGDEETVNQANAARAEVENAILTGDDQEQKDALERIKSREAEEEQNAAGQGENGEQGEAAKSPEQTIEEAAQQEFNTSVENMAENLGGNKETMQANAARSMISAGAAGSNEIVKQALGAENLAEGETKDVTSMVSDDAKNEAILSTLSDDEKVAYSSMNDRQQQAFLKNYAVSATVDNAGNISMQVGKKGADGKLDESTAKTVDSKVANGIIANSLDDAQVNKAVESSGASSAVATFAAGNIASTINFGNAANDSIADQVIKGVMANPANKQNGAVIDEAIMNLIKSDPQMAQTFMKFTRLSAQQMQDPELVKTRISELRKGGLDVKSLGIKSEDYMPFMAGAIQTSVQNGQFKLTAWDMLKSNSPSQTQQLVEKAAEKSMIKTNDEIVLEEKKSREAAENVDTATLLQIMKNTGNIDPEKIAQLFEKFNSTNIDSAKEDLEKLKASTGFSSIANKLGVEEIEESDYLKAIQIAKLNNESLDAGNIGDILVQMNNNSNYIANRMLSGMLNSKSSGNFEEVKRMVGGDQSIYTSNEIGELKDAYASNAFAGMTKEQQDEFIDKTGMSKEDAEKLSLYEFNVLNDESNGATIDERKKKAYDTLHQENKVNRAINAAIESEGVDSEVLIDYIANNENSKQAFISAYSARMRVVDDKDEAEAETEAEKQVLTELLKEKGVKLKGNVSLEELYTEFTESQPAKVKAEIDAEVNNQVAAKIHDEVGEKKFSRVKKEWLNNNKGKTDADFNAVLAKDPTILGIELGDEFKGDKLEAMKADFKHKKLRSMAEESIDGFAASVDAEKDELLEKKNKEKLNAGAGEHAFAVSAALSKDARVMKEAAALYNQMYSSSDDNYVEFEKLDEFAKASFMYTHFKDKVNVSVGSQTGDAVSRLANDPEKFASVFEFMQSYDAGEDANKAGAEIKQAVMRAELEKYGVNNVKLAQNPDKMDAETRKRFELNQSILQTEIRSNPQILANLFTNNTILGQDKIVAEIARAQGLDVNYDKDGNMFSVDEEGNTLNINELKAKLDPERVVAYMNSHEETKNKLVSIGAQDMVTSLDQGSQDMKKVDAVLSSAYLRNEVTDKVVAESGLSEDKIKYLIKQMLTNSGRGDKLGNTPEEASAYIDKHYSELKTELALHFTKNEYGKYEYNADGKNPAVFLETMKDLEKNNLLFKNNLNREVTRIIDPANYDPETSSQEFFAVRTLDEFMVQENDNIQNMSGAIDKFFSKGFKGFSKNTKVMVDTIKGNKELQAETMRDMVSDKELLEYANANNIELKVDDQELLKVAKNDDYMKARLGAKINDNAAVKAFLDDEKNKKVKERLTGVAKVNKFKQNAAEYNNAVGAILFKNGQVTTNYSLSDDEIVAAVKDKNNSASAEIRKLIAIDSAANGGKKLDKMSDKEIVEFVNSHKAEAREMTDTINLEKIKKGEISVNLTESATKSYVKKTDSRVKKANKEKLDAIKAGQKELDAEETARQKVEDKQARKDAKVERKKQIQLAAEQNKSEVFVKKGKFAEKTVENISLYNAFIQKYNTAKTPEEKQQLLGSVGGKLDYDSVMMGLYTRQDSNGNISAGWQLRQDLKNEVRANKAKEIFKNELLTASGKGSVDEIGNDEVLQWLDKNKSKSKKVNKALENKGSVAEIAGKELKHEARNAAISDKQMDAYINDESKNIAISDSDLFKAAQNDKFMLARFGGKIDESNKADVLDYIKRNSEDHKRLRVKVARSDTKLTKEAFNSIKRTNATEDDVLAYAKKNGIVAGFIDEQDIVKLAKSDLGANASDDEIRGHISKNFKQLMKRAEVEKIKEKAPKIVETVASEKEKSIENDAINKYFAGKKKNNTENNRVRRADIQREADRVAENKGVKAKNAYDSSVTSTLKKGTFAKKTVENTMIFNELENNAELKNEVISKLEGKEYNYDNVMQVVAGNARINAALKDSVKVRKLSELAASDETLKKEIDGKSDSELLEFLNDKNNSKYAKKVNNELSSTNKNKVAAEVNKNASLAAEVYQSTVTDEQINKYAQAHGINVTVNDSEALNFAMKDAFLMGKLKARGQSAEDYFNSNPQELEKYREKAKVQKLRSDSELMKDVFVSERRKRIEKQGISNDDIWTKLQKDKNQTFNATSEEAIQLAIQDTSIQKRLDEFRAKNWASTTKVNKETIIKKFFEQEFGKQEGDAQKFEEFKKQATIQKARQNKDLISEIVTEKSNSSELSVDEINSYFSGKVSSNRVRYKKTHQKLDSTFLHKMGVVTESAGIATAAVGKFFGLTLKEGGKGLTYDRNNAFNRGVFTAAKGTWHGIKTAGIGVKTASQATWNGVKNIAISGTNAVIFKAAGKLPEMCVQYERWNKVLNHKITQVKNDTTLTRKQKEEQIKIYESQKIFVKKPASYKNMTPEEQNAFDLEQDKLRRSAYTNKNLIQYIKNIERVKKNDNQAGLGFVGTLRYLAHPIKNVKDKHLADYHDMHDKARRFRATAAMRNHERDFGDNFDDFAKTFLSRKRYIDMVKRYKLKSAIEYRNMTIAQKEKERRAREAALAAQISRINRILGKKVARDSKVNPKSFLAQNGYADELLRYKNGMNKFNNSNDMKTRLGRGEKRELKDTHKIMQAKNYASNIDKTMQEFMKFSAGYKGSSADFARELKAYAEKLGADNKAIIDKIYKKYANLFRGGLGRLENSPVAVQQRKIMESFASELKKCQQRVTFNGKIPASAEMNSRFVGKTFSGSTTKAQIELNKQHADDLSRLVKLIKDQKNLVSYESLKSRISRTLMDEFENANRGIASKSEQAKKTALENYFSKKLDEALKKVHNDQYMKSDKHQLEKLNGRRVKKSEIDKSRHSPVMQEAMKTADNPVYQKIVRDFNSASEKVKAEQFNYDQLYAALLRSKNGLRTAKNIGRTIELQKAVKQSEIKLRTLKNLFNTAKTRKTDFEQSFARAQIKEAKASSRVRGYNSSVSVMDRYSFPKKNGTVIAKGTSEAKQVEILVSNYIQGYRNVIENMLKKEDIRKHENLRKYIEEMKKKFTADFGRNMKYTREVKEQLQKYMKELEKSTEASDKKLRDELDRRVTELNETENKLSGRMNEMQIDLSNVKLKK